MSGVNSALPICAVFRTNPEQLLSHPYREVYPSSRSQHMHRIWLVREVLGMVIQSSKKPDQARIVQVCRSFWSCGIPFLWEDIPSVDVLLDLFWHENASEEAETDEVLGHNIDEHSEIEAHPPSSLSQNPRSVPTQQHLVSSTKRPWTTCQTFGP